MGVDETNNFKKIYGINDDIPEEGSFKVTNDVEYFFKDQLNAKLRDFDDLKAQIAILDRHLRKHSGGHPTDHNLSNLDELVIKPYEEGLKSLKSKVIEAGNDDWSAATVVMINTIMDKAEQFLEMSRNQVYNTLDNHVASEEHRNEHKHGDDEEHDHGHAGDHAADYADLLTDETDVIISSQDEELLIEYLDSDIEDLENIIKEKEHLEHHIVEHYNLEDVDADELQLKVAENVLDNIDVEKLKSYEESLQLLKAKLLQSNGQVKSDLAKEIANTMQNAETLSRAFQKNIEIAVTFDHEFEKYEETAKLETPQSEIKPSNDESPNVKFVFDISYPELKQDDDNKGKETLDTASKKSAGGGPDGLKEDSSKVGEVWSEYKIFGKLLSFPLSALLIVLTLVVLVATMATAAHRAFYSRNYKGSSCEMGRTPSDKAALISKHTISPQLEMVKEDSGWTSNNWGQSWAATPNRRRKQK